MSERVARRKVVVTNPAGLHLRPVDAFVKTARQFSAKIVVSKDTERVDGKSVMALLALAAVESTELEIEATGTDAEAAVIALWELVHRNFGEEAAPHG